jgi:hypothetical protein
LGRQAVEEKGKKNKKEKRNQKQAWTAFRSLLSIYKKY